MANQLDFQRLIQNYRLVLITPFEFIHQYMDFLQSSGAGQPLADVMNQQCQDLADCLVDILEESDDIIGDDDTNAI